MFQVIREIGEIVIAVLAWCAIRKSKIEKKRKAMGIAVLAVILLGVVVSIYPVENLFLRFPSAEAAYKYTHGSSFSSCDVIEGENSAIVLAVDEDSSLNFSIIPRKKDGWILATVFDQKDEIIHYSDELVTAWISQSKKTGDCYLLLTCLSSENDEITDTNGSVFHEITRKPSGQAAGITEYCAYIGEMPNDYVFTINGTTYQLTAE